MEHRNDNKKLLSFFWSCLVMDINIITYLACICFIFLFGRIFIVPLKKIFKLIFNSILGGVSIFIINLVGGTFGFHIGLNFFTSILIRHFRVTRSSSININKINIRMILKFFKNYSK
jgi:inhibitor of the pro-sigma K processing machinery